MDNRHTFSGEKINPPTIFPNMDCSELINFLVELVTMLGASPKLSGHSKEMIDSDSTICLTLAGQ